ncbi:hypothetical protein B296_00001312 [Ensete ventricosum]|uniref:Uncharacterized protein n=1 Tax=Ensete ventricosum TaxID=4639 RepID=A0A427B201_ENSVE|nr:hypothetical protein B296_00001312 [Ensete ventricosum]
MQLSLAYVVDIIELDHNKIIDVSKWGTETVGNDKGCGRGQRCDYVTGEATIEEKTTTSRGSRKQESSGGGRCASKDGRGGWAALEGAATAALDLLAGRVSKAKGAMKATTGRGGRKRAVAVRRGLR